MKPLIWRIEDWIDPAGADRRSVERLRRAIARVAVAMAKFGLASEQAARAARKLASK